MNTHKRKINDYTVKTVDNIIKSEFQKKNAAVANEPKAKTTDNNERKIQSYLSFSGKKGLEPLSQMKSRLKKSILSNVKTCITYEWHEDTKLSTQFPV